jgi:hypothetical protein
MGREDAVVFVVAFRNTVGILYTVRLLQKISIICARRWGMAQIRAGNSENGRSGLLPRGAVGSRKEWAGGGEEAIVGGAT